MRKSSDNDATEERGLAQFELVGHLGKGAAGMVNLIRSKKTGEQFALKTMNLEFLSAKDKESALREVEFLRVICGPTIIKFQDAFKEN